MVVTRPRLAEVALMAGVSQKTVSNVLNNYPHVTDRTRTKVLDALKALDYRVNPSARMLARGRTGFIALGVPTLENPYFAQLALRMMSAAAQHGWTVLIEQTGGRGSSESEVITGSMPLLVDGIVLHLESLEYGELHARGDRTPLVLVGEKGPHHVADHVAADNAAAARALTEHLLLSGRRRIAVVGLARDSTLTPSALRYEGYAAALADAGLQPGPVIHPARYDRAAGAAAAPELLASDADAVICFNDTLAVGVLSGLATAGARVPEDLAVAGFDATDESGFTAPPLTSVAWDTTAIAERAMDLLAQRLADESRPPQAVSVGWELVRRRSTAPARG